LPEEEEEEEEEEREEHKQQGRTEQRGYADARAHSNFFQEAT